MRFILIGAGRVASHLGLALKQAGHTIVQVYSRTEASASRLSALLSCDYTTNISSLHEADAMIFMVSDSILPELIDSATAVHPSTMAIHTAGSMPMTLFEGKSEHYGVIYPMQTFSMDKEIDFHKVPCFVEASDSQTLHTISEIARSVSGQVRELAYSDRLYLHLAAVFASNMVNHCYHIAASICEEHGIDFHDLLPLIQETAMKVSTMSPHDAQTGPAVRGDKNVMQRQLGLLYQHKEIKEIYRQMSINIEKMHHDDKL